MMPNVKCYRSYLLMKHKLNNLRKLRKTNFIFKTKNQKLILENNWLKIKTNEIKVDEILYSDNKYLNLVVLHNEIQNTLLLCDQYKELSSHI